MQTFVFNRRLLISFNISYFLNFIRGLTCTAINQNANFLNRFKYIVGKPINIQVTHNDICNKADKFCTERLGTLQY